MFVMFGLVSAVIEFPIEQLNSYDREYEHEEHINNQYGSHVFEGINHAHEDGLKILVKAIEIAKWKMPHQRI